MFPQHRVRTRDVRKANRATLKEQIAERKAYDAALVQLREVARERTP